MKKYILLFISLIILIPSSVFSLPAFPGAEGFGTATTGGRNAAATVYIVSNLNNSGTGSFRAAVEASGARYVVFAVSGHIHLTAPLTVTNPYITIAGQTSPGGICISGGIFEISTHDVVITHMRYRMGGDVCVTNNNCDTYGDAIRISANSSNTYNIVLDHCSISWGNDETLDISALNGAVYGVTISNSLIAQGLDDNTEESNHALGFLIWQYGATQLMTISMHHNYMAHFRYRFPEVQDEQFVDIRNNVFYNWSNSTNSFLYFDGSYTNQINLVDNYYKPGPSMGGENECGVDASEGYACGEGTNCTPSGTPRETIYIHGNLGCGRTSQSDPDGTSAHLRYGWSPGGWLASGWIKSTAFATTSADVTTTEMSTSYAATVISGAGATKCQSTSTCLDSIDTAFKADYTNNTGSWLADIRYSNYPTGWPTYSSPSSPTDSDSDGMSDAWETSTFGSTSATANADADSDGYSNLEEYLFELGGYAQADTTAPVITISDSDPKNVTASSTTLTGTSSDANDIDECKWRSGSAPDEGNGTACTGTTSWSCSVTGLSEGANTIYVGCADPSNNWGSDSITINADTIAPTFSSASINGQTAVINLSEDVDITGLDNGDFTMTGSTSGTIPLNSCVENNGAISCTAASAFVYNETVTAAYNGSANEVEDLFGNDLAIFTGSAVTNNTPPVANPGVVGIGATGTGPSFGATGTAAIFE